MSDTPAFNPRASNDMELGEHLSNNTKSVKVATLREDSGPQLKEVDGTLPKGVKLILEAGQQQAQAVGIVMALFAGALVSLAQMVEGVDGEKVDVTSNPWSALRVFLYGAIMLNLLGAFMSLITIKMCSDLPIAYYQAAHKTEEPQQTRLRHKATPKLNPRSRKGLLRGAGMSRTYFVVDTINAWVLISACVCTFTSLALWVSINTANTVTLRSTMVIFTVCGLVFVVAVRLAGRAQGWV